MIFNGFLRFFGLLGRSWEALGALLRLLGASWERSWKLLARSWVSGVDHGGSWADVRRFSKIYKNLRNTIVFYMVF